MYIRETIFNELEEVNITDQRLNYEIDPAAKRFINNILPKLKQREANFSLDQKLNEYEKQEIFETKIQYVVKFQLESVLFEALALFYGNARNVLNYVRSAVFDPQTGYIYAVIGTNPHRPEYDYIDQDILNGNGDGHTEKKFLYRINEEDHYSH